MHGLHLIADLRGCASAPGVGGSLMTDPAALRGACLGAVRSAGLQPVGELFHRFTPAADADAAQSGVTGVVLLAESHLAVHTWPELNATTIDVYVCNFQGDNSARADRALEHLVAAFAPGTVVRQRIERGRA
jgi:S-adenosylmethionine decarboxylase proenzyme